MTPVDSPFEAAFAAAGVELPAPFRAEFLVGPDSPFTVKLVGRMDIWRRHRWLAPLYWLLARAGVMVGATGTNIPTTLTVEPGRDARGAPFHIQRRVFALAPPVRFDTLTTWDAARGCLVDHTGPGRTMLLFWQVRLTAASPGSLTGAPQSGAAAELQMIPLGFALAFGARALALPRWLWPLLIGTPRFTQRALLDPPGAVEVDLAVAHPLLGDLFGYRGVFTVSRVPRR